jgi:hypothetical protein
MQNFIPVLQLPEESAPQAAPRDKLGGLPWGLRPEMWPICKECGKSQSLLAQFVHDSARLDLGRPGRMLNVFQCNHDPGMCATWEGGSGANACFVVEPEDLAPSLTAQPMDNPSIELEAYVIDWESRDDGISSEEAAAFFPPEELPDAPPIRPTHQPTTSTRLGGVPFWIQHPDEAPKGGWRFFGQLDSTYSFLQAPAKAHPEVRPDSENWEGRSHYAQGPNFGDGGIAYLFLRHEDPVPQGWFFWQCG